MKKYAADQDERSSKSSPGWRVVLAAGIFCSWVIGSATILYFSNSNVHTPQDKTRGPASSGDKATSLDNAKQATNDPVEVTVPFSTSVEENGGRYRIFHFPDNIVIGSIGTIERKSLGSGRGKVIYSASEVVRGTSNPAQGIVKFPAEAHLSFVPGKIIGINPSYITRFRPGEIFDLTMTKIHDIDVDAYIEACSQMRGVTRLDLSANDDLTQEGVPFIDEYESIKQLNLVVNQRKLAQIANLATIKNVTSLGLDSRVDVDPILHGLNYSPNLKALKIHTERISGEGLTTIAVLPQLQELFLSSAVFDDPDSTNNALKILSKAPHLKVLTCESGQKNKTVQTNAYTDRIIQTFKSLVMLRLGAKTIFVKTLKDGA